MRNAKPYYPDYLKEYSDIFEADKAEKEKRRKAYKAGPCNSEKDRRHGKKKTLTRKEKIQGEYVWKTCGNRQIPAYKKRNRKKEMVPAEEAV